MLYPVFLFRRLGVVPVIHGTDQIAGDAADAFKRHLFKFIVQIRVISVEVNIEAF